MTVFEQYKGWEAKDNARVGVEWASIDTNDPIAVDRLIDIQARRCESAYRKYNITFRGDQPQGVA